MHKDSVTIEHGWEVFLKVITVNRACDAASLRVGVPREDDERTLISGANSTPKRKGMPGCLLFGLYIIELSCFRAYNEPISLLRTRVIVITSSRCNSGRQGDKSTPGSVYRRAQQRIHLSIKRDETTQEACQNT